MSQAVRTIGSVPMMAPIGCRLGTADDKPFASIMILVAGAACIAGGNLSAGTCIQVRVRSREGGHVAASTPVSETLCARLDAARGWRVLNHRAHAWHRWLRPAAPSAGAQRWPTCR